MRKLVLILVVLGMVLSINAAEPVQSADATSAWNQYAQAYNFSVYPGALQYTSFSSAYSGSNFNADFGGILSAVAHAMGTGTPPWGGGDPFSYVENWPER